MSSSNVSKNIKEILTDQKNKIEKNVKDTINDVSVSLKDNVKNPQNIKNNVLGRINNIRSYFNQKTENITNTSNNFITNTSVITKFFILFFILFLFYLIFNLGVFLIIKYFSIKRNPIILNGRIKSNEEKIVSTNPNIKGSIPILRSVNEKNGIEYTWSCWFFVEDMYINENVNKRIFSKGVNTRNLNEYTKLINNSPGLYISENSNKDMNNLKFVFNTYNDMDNSTFEPYESFDINNIPIKKWVNVLFILNNKRVDVYINGILKKVHHLKNIPRQNYYDIHIGDKEGFVGYISDLKYYDYSLSYSHIQDIFISGPKDKDIDNKKDILSDKAPIMSMDWYYK